MTFWLYVAGGAVGGILFVLADLRRCARPWRAALRTPTGKIKKRRPRLKEYVCWTELLWELVYAEIGGIGTGVLLHFFLMPGGIASGLSELISGWANAGILVLATVVSAVVNQGLGVLLGRIPWLRKLIRRYPKEPPEIPPSPPAEGKGREASPQSGGEGS